MRIATPLDDAGPGGALDDRQGLPPVPRADNDLASERLLVLHDVLEEPVEATQEVVVQHCHLIDDDQLGLSDQPGRLGLGLHAEGAVLAGSERGLEPGVEGAAQGQVHGSLARSGGGQGHAPARPLAAGGLQHGIEEESLATAAPRLQEEAAAAAGLHRGHDLLVHGVLLGVELHDDLLDLGAELRTVKVQLLAEDHGQAPGVVGHGRLLLLGGRVQAEEGQLLLEGQQPLLDVLQHQGLQLGFVPDLVDVVDNVLLGSLEDNVVRPVPAGVVTKTGSVGRPVPELIEQVGGFGGRAPHEDVEVEAPDGLGIVPGEGLVQGHLPLAVVLQEAEVLAHRLVCEQIFLLVVDDDST